MIDGNIVLAGAKGLLGCSFARSLEGRHLIALGSDALDPATPDLVIRKIVDLSPSLVINCAADTDVEGAEAFPTRAFAINATLAEALARAASASGATMLHFSSTGCYGSWKSTPYIESDALRPTTMHHRSKAEGEALVLRAAPKAIILRLGWVFGGLPGQRKNFVWARLVEASDKTAIGSNHLQFGCPTFTDDIVSQAHVLLNSGALGIFNCVGNGTVASRLDYVKEILTASGSRTCVVPVSFARRAPVSPNESALNARLHCLGLDNMPPWRASLATFVASLVSGGFPSKAVRSV